MIGERPAAPSLRYVTEQPVLDLIPLGGAGRIVVDVNDETGLVGQFLQFDLPKPPPRAIRAPAVRRDGQRACRWIAPSSHAPVPAPDRLHRKRGGVAGEADADEASIVGYVIHPIGNYLAALPVFEVVHLDAPRPARRPIVGSAILEIADQFFLLRIYGNDGLVFGLRGNHFLVDVFELRIAVGMVRSLIRLAIGLPREA